MLLPRLVRGGVPSKSSTRNAYAQTGWQVCGWPQPALTTGPVYAPGSQLFLRPLSRSCAGPPGTT
eukprot:9320490-Alexandrium_andersonii.AAC.1